MTSLQLGLIIAGILLVVGVLIYNWIQERRVRRRIDDAFRKSATRGDALLDSPSASVRGSERVEPTLAPADGAAEPMLTRAGADGAAAGRRGTPDGRDDEQDFALPVQVRSRMPATDAHIEPHREPRTDAALADDRRAPASPSSMPAPERVVHADAHGAQPDPDIECIVALQPTKPVPVGVLAAGLNARVGKRLRWFGRRGVSMPWQLLKPETTGDFSDVVACLLLADRTGAVSAPMLEAFTRVMANLAPTLPAVLTAPDIPREAARAQTLDRICADLDVQIGLTILKHSPATIPGTRLRGVAEAAGFRLAGGRFEWVQEETGAVLYALQNFRAEPLTVDTLRATSTPGAVFLLDVPRVADPVRVFDQMKLAAKRMAQTLDAALVDDNRRALDDAALTSIRTQIQATVAQLHAVHIEPGTPRALALFGG